MVTLAYLIDLLDDMSVNAVDDVDLTIIYGLPHGLKDL